MTTPKSPEEIMEELREMTQPYCASGCGCFEDGIPGHEGSCVTKCSTFEEQKAWLRSSMASLLCYMAERMPGMYLKEDCDEMHCCSEEHDEPRVMHCHEHNDAVQKCISILEEEAKNISNE